MEEKYSCDDKNQLQKYVDVVTSFSLSSTPAPKAKTGAERQREYRLRKRQIRIEERERRRQETANLLKENGLSIRSYEISLLSKRASEAKTGAERQREYRLRKRQIRIQERQERRRQEAINLLKGNGCEISLPSTPVPKAKTAAERVREYRLRQRQKQLEKLEKSPIDNDEIFSENKISRIETTFESAIHNTQILGTSTNKNKPAVVNDCLGKITNMNIKIEYNDEVSIKTENDSVNDSYEETETEIMEETCKIEKLIEEEPMPLLTNMNIKIEYNDEVSIKTEENDPFYDNYEETETEIAEEKSNIEKLVGKEPTSIMCEDFEDNYCNVLKEEIKQEPSPCASEIDLEMTVEEENDPGTSKTENPVENPRLLAPSVQMNVPISTTNGQLPVNSLILLTPTLQQTSNRPSLIILNPPSHANIPNSLQNPHLLLCWNGKPSEKDLMSVPSR